MRGDDTRDSTNVWELGLRVDGFDKSGFRFKANNGKNISHTVYTKGDGPVVVIIQELPGIGPETLALAGKFVDEGFTAVLPHLFGPLGKTAMNSNLLRVFCMRKEFNLFEKGKTSPIVDWLRALCQDLRTQHQTKGVAVIGMCLTGNFAISLMADDSVLAGVSSQPSMPLGKHDALHMSSQDISEIRKQLDQKGPMLAYRFEGDKFCQAEKFKAIDQTFNDDTPRVKLTTIPGNGHSVLTLDFVDQTGHPTRTAFDEVLTYFRGALA